MDRDQLRYVQMIESDKEWRPYIFKRIDDNAQEVKAFRQEINEEIKEINQNLKELLSKFDQAQGALRVTAALAGLLSGSISTWITSKFG